MQNMEVIMKSAQNKNLGVSASKREKAQSQAKKLIKQTKNTPFHACSESEP